MLDRASTFAHPEIVRMLSTRFVPVAINQACQRKQNDAEGELYRKIAVQGPRPDFNGTTQGFYAATNSGRLLFYNNNRNPERLADLLKKALADDTSNIEKTAPLPDSPNRDQRFEPVPPQEGLVVRVHSRVLGGYKAPQNESEKIFQESLSRDNLWITRTEHEALARGEVPKVLQTRMARFHLVDNTRGEPPMWEADEIESIEMKLVSGHLTGSAKLKSKQGDRDFEVDFFGFVETNQSGKVMRFDLIAKGLFRGHGPYTANPPPGLFPLGISFTLADGNDIADAIPPQGTRGWPQGYLR